MYFDPTMVLLFAGLLLGLWAQAKVKGAYAKYSKVVTERQVPAAAAVQDLLRLQGVDDVVISPVEGELTDHFDPKTDTLRLSAGVYGSASVAAVGIAAHEAGHALQKKENFPFLALRSALVPAVNIGSNLAWPLFFLGILFSWQPLMTAGIVCFSLAVLFSLITLPVEFDASRRAMAMLAGSGYLTQEEEKGVKTVLTAAAMTYVASFVSALLQLLRLILLSNRRRR